jgi:hypothetical protein
MDARMAASSLTPTARSAAGSPVSRSCLLAADAGSVLGSPPVAAAEWQRLLRAGFAAQPVDGHGPLG